ncbi:MAG: ferric reductase-like transmembrane domain-containing protein [Myxococcota bacterium]
MTASHPSRDAARPDPGVAPTATAGLARPARAMTIPLVVATFFVGTLVLGGALGLNGTGRVGWHAAVRATAVVAFPLWLLVYTAGPLAQLAPGSVTRALRRSRRAIGLAVFVAQMIHLAAILGLTRLEAGTLTEPAALYGGGLAYLMLTLMAATSNDAAVARLGARNWRRLHGFGQGVLAIVYVATYGPLMAGDPAYWPAGLALLAAFGLRATAFWKRRASARA